MGMLDVSNRKFIEKRGKKMKRRKISSSSFFLIIKEFILE
jgi:hypothetical protein